MNEPLKDGMGPGDHAPILLHHNGNHTLIKLIKVIPMPLTIGSALGLFLLGEAHEQQAGLATVQARTLSQSSEPDGSMMCRSALWMPSWV